MQKGKWMSKKELKGTILVGDGSELLDFYAHLSHPEKVLGIFCSLAVILPAGLTRLGDVGEAPSYLDEHVQVQRVYCSTSAIAADKVRAVQYACKARAVRFCAVLPVINKLDARMVTMNVGGEMLLTTQNEPLSYLHNRLIKRLMDLLLVSVFMLTAFPFVYIYKAIVMKRKQAGPSFRFRPSCGPNGRIFNQVSFRDEENSLARVFNVFVGSMSLVGPSCYTLGDEEEPINLPKRLERKEVKAGMTGWAQLQKATGEKRLDADIWYAEHWSVWLDLRILFKSMF